MKLVLLISLFAVSTYAHASFNHMRNQNLPDGTVYYNGVTYNHDGNTYAVKPNQNNANLACEAFFPNSTAIEFIEGHFSTAYMSFVLDFSEHGDITSVTMTSPTTIGHLRCSL